VEAAVGREESIGGEGVDVGVVGEIVSKGVDSGVCGRCRAGPWGWSRPSNALLWLTPFTVQPALSASPLMEQKDHGKAPSLSSVTRSAIQSGTLSPENGAKEQLTMPALQKPSRTMITSLTRRPCTQLRH